MQANASMRQRARLGFLLPLILTAGCGTGDGPTPILGTPAPPPPPITCDTINFEDGCGPFSFVDFGGGVTSIVSNPEVAGINTSAKAARMQKFAGEVFAGSALNLDRSLDFSQGQAFRMKVRASRAVPVLFKLEGPDPTSQADDRERSVSYGGSGGWEELCFDFTGDTAGLTSRAITFIFDLGVSGNAASDPNNWTFFFDEIEQAADCGVPVIAFPVDFEGDPASYNFGADGGFGGGASSVIANPAPGGINTSAQVARMQKFPGEVFGGSTLSLGSAVDFSQGQAFRMKVRANRAVPVLFKFEGPDPNSQADDRERTVSHGGSGGWEDLCFDFTGDTAGLSSRAITFIFDLGVNGNATADPANWTFYFDDIEQVASCGVATGPLFPVDFEGDPAGYNFGPGGGFGGGASAVIANPASGGINTSAQVARMQKFPGEVFGGSTLSLGGNVDFAQGAAFRMKVRASRAVPVLFKFEGLNQERSLSHSGSGAWEVLCFDFTGSTAGPASSAITFIFDLGVNGNATADPANWTFYFDDIEQVASCGGGGGTPASVDFEGDPAQFDFGPGGGFGGGVSTVIANPDQSGINTSAQVVQMEKFAGEVFGGSTLALPGGVNWGQGETFTMKVWSRRTVPVLFKLEGGGLRERTRTHDGGSAWQELCFDFTGATAGEPVTGFTIIFDLGVPGNAGTDPDNWTFYYDEIQQGSGGCATPPPPPSSSFATITFDDPATTYTLTDFGGNLSSLTNDPAGGTNQVAMVVKPVGAQLWAGTTVSTLPNDSVPRIPLSASSTRMSVRVYSPDAGIPVLLKIEDASNGALSVETTATTTQVNTWETLTFDFANQVPGTPAFNAANTYSRISIFFNFGTTGAAAGEKTYYFDDVAVDDGSGGGGAGIIPEAVVFATDPSVARDLAPPEIANFGSGAVFDGTFAGDADYNPAFQVTSGQGYGAGVHVGFVAFNSYAAGFAAGFGTFEFKVKVNAPGLVSAFEVKFINGGDTSRTYDLATYSGSTALGNGWYQVQIPMSDFAATIAANSGFLLGPLGGQSGAFTMLLTDIGFSGTAGGGAGCDPVGNEFAAANGDFELGNLDCWTTFNNGGTIGVVADNGPGAAGSSAGRLNVTIPGNPTLKLANLGAGTLTPGQPVTVSFDWKGTGANGGVVDVVLFSELSGGGVSKTDQLLGGGSFPANWTTAGPFNLTAGPDVSGGVTLQITAICGGDAGCVSEVFIDNVSIVIN